MSICSLDSLVLQAFVKCSLDVYLNLELQSDDSLKLFCLNLINFQAQTVFF